MHSALLLLAATLLLLLLPTTGSCLEHPRSLRLARSPLDDSGRDGRVIFPDRDSSGDEGNRPVYRGRRHREGGYVSSRNRYGFV